MAAGMLPTDGNEGALFVSMVPPFVSTVRFHPMPENQAFHPFGSNPFPFPFPPSNLRFPFPA